MRSITILYDGTGYTYRWVKAMLWAKSEFKTLGYKIELCSFTDYFPMPSTYSNKFLNVRLKNACRKKYDILFLAFHYSTNEIGRDIKYRHELLKILRDRTNLLCWLDTADSTGSCLFDVLPYVDLYFKKQILRDRSLYTKKIYCDRVFAEYYHNKYDLIDSKNDIEPCLLPECYISKLRIAWNITYYDYLGGRFYHILHPYKLAQEHLIEVDLDSRDYDIYYNGSNPSVYGPVIGYQRKYILDYINNLTDAVHPDVYKKISREQYLKDLDNTKAIASPFGWGECCLRDMEAFIHGAILIKPSMEHCETYPDIYKEYKTYVPIQWDFSDLDDVVKNIKGGMYKDIAREGQLQYEYFMSKEGKADFASHIVKQLTMDNCSSFDEKSLKV